MAGQGPTWDWGGPDEPYGPPTKQQYYDSLPPMGPFKDPKEYTKPSSAWAPLPYAGKGGGAGVGAPQAFTPSPGGLLFDPVYNPPPPLPHKDASDQSLGPNLGGRDAVEDPPTPTYNWMPAAGVAFGGAAILLLLLGRRR